MDITPGRRLTHNEIQAMADPATGLVPGVIHPDYDGDDDDYYYWFPDMESAVHHEQQRRRKMGYPDDD